MTEATRQDKPFKNLNKTLVQKIKEQILNEPQSFHMCYWGILDNHEITEGGNLGRLLLKENFCQTTACLAGWAWLLGNGHHEATLDSWQNFSAAAAADLLGITEGEPRCDLFYEENWPKPFNANYQRALSSQKRAEVVAAYLDWLVEDDAPTRDITPDQTT